MDATLANMQIAVGDLLYFSAFDPVTFTELWVYGSLGTLQQVMDIMPGSSGNLAGTCTSCTATPCTSAPRTPRTASSMQAHDTVSGITWKVTHINEGHGHAYPGNNFHALVDDTLYFDALTLEHGVELWAHTINANTLAGGRHVQRHRKQQPGRNLSHVSGTTLYFDASTGPEPSELWAYETTNGSLWQVTDIVRPPWAPAKWALVSTSPSKSVIRCTSTPTTATRAANCGRTACARTCGG